MESTISDICENIPPPYDKKKSEIVTSCEAQHPAALGTTDIEVLSVILLVVVALLGLLGTILNTKKDTNKKGFAVSNFSTLAISLAVLLVVCTIGSYFVGNQKSQYQAQTSCIADYLTELRDANLKTIRAQTDCLSQNTERLGVSVDSLEEQSGKLNDQSSQIKDQIGVVELSQQTLVNVTQEMLGVSSENSANNQKLEILIKQIAEIRTHLQNAEDEVSGEFPIDDQAGEKANQGAPYIAPDPFQNIEYEISLQSIDAVTKCESNKSNGIYWSLGVDGKIFTELAPHDFTKWLKIDTKQIASTKANNGVALLSKMGRDPQFNFYGYVRHTAGNTTMFRNYIKYFYTAALKQVVKYDDNEPHQYELRIKASEDCIIDIGVLIVPQPY